MLLFVISLGLTPVYHVRYLFLSAPPFALAAAGAAIGLFRRRRWLGLAWQ